MNNKLIIAAGLIMLTAFSAAGQNKSEFPDKVLDEMYERLTQSQQKTATVKENEKILSDNIDLRNAKLDAWLKQTQKEDAFMLKNYRPAYNHKPGDMNLFPVWEEIPAPIPSLPEAKQTNIDLKYEGFIKKVELLQKQLSDMEQQHIGQQRSDKESIMADTKAMAGRNAVVQQMGGVDAVMNMSEAERKAAAKKIKENVLTNPGEYSGVPDAGMNAMMERMMKDAGYREKYNKMSNSEKQAELQKFMSNKTVERNDQAFEQSLHERNGANSAIDLQLLLGKCLKQMQEAAHRSSEGTTLANDLYNSLYRSLGDWYGKKYNALPLNVIGEREGAGPLEKFYAFLIYQVQKKEAATRTILWSGLKARTKIAFGEFNDFIGSYPWGKMKNSSMLNGAYTEPNVAAAVTGLYDQMIQLTKSAETLTLIHKGQQETFELIINKH